MQHQDLIQQAVDYLKLQAALYLPEELTWTDSVEKASKHNRNSMDS